jgi:hypothetical protein
MESFMCLYVMNYEKANPNPAVKRTVLSDWRILIMISQLLKQKD